MITVPPGDPRFPGNAPWIELSASAVRQNIDVFRGVLREGSQLGAVLKGNAYGHGFPQMLELVHPLVDLIYVITPQDALAVRAFEADHGTPHKQVIVLGALVPEEAVELARRNIDAVVADAGADEAAARLREARSSGPLRCHLHIDTGLGREGFTPAQLPEAAELFRRNSDVLSVVGLMSHFSNTEDVTEQEYALSQLDVFGRSASYLSGQLPLPPTLVRHFAASAATMVLPPAQFQFSAVRVGISLYGLWPSAETRLSARLVLGDVPRLQPVLSWRCASQVVKWLPAGSFVGYGCTYRCPQDTRVAVLPVGYFDGYPRIVSGKAHVLVNGQRCPVLGRVMMNHIVIDVTRAAPSDAKSVIATLIGTDGDEELSADTLAGWAQTINYELVARLGPHLQRVVVP